ncbi:MAG: hypothetical protein Q9220_000670 [cf. Caloplaca sp. 1 TL-2023]
MAATSSGIKPKVKKIEKTGTTSKRKHRFASFNQRISKLSIDPIHKTRRTDSALIDDDPTASYFKADLDKWKDLNLSENFTQFVREVAPLCDTLPQVLHYHLQIAQLLHSYIEKRDSPSLEPLLSLLSCFAHDIGLKFEVHFSGLVSLVALLAARHPEVEVIEWSFNCLAWLFKYLSRLLVPDLRPLLQIISPLLGKESQKPFIIRFASESLSFLLRKAALVRHKNPKPLQNAIDFILEEVDAVAGQGNTNPSYCRGLKTLLVDAIKGIDRGLHSSGSASYSFLLDASLSDIKKVQGRMELLEGITIGLIHHTEASTFQPLLDNVLGGIGRLLALEKDVKSPTMVLEVYERLLCVLSTVRKGSRVQNWGPLLDALMDLLSLRREQQQKPSQDLVEAAAMIMQSVSLDLLTPKLRPIMNQILSDLDHFQFLLFCNFFCELDQPRFDLMIQPYFIKFLNSNWQTQQRQLCLSLPMSMRSDSKINIKVPTSWQTEIISCFELARDSGEESCIQRCHDYLQASSTLDLSVSTRETIMHILEMMIQSSVQSPGQSDTRRTFIFGAGLKFCAEHEQQSPHPSPKVWQVASIMAEHYKTMPLFLEGILISMNADKSALGTPLDSLVEQVTENLHSSSYILRNLSLQIISRAFIRIYGSEADILATALTIENMPLDLKSARTISMYVRKLASQYKDGNIHHWLQKAIIHFCFGLQTLKLSPIWNDAIEVLEQICESSTGENLVSDLGFRWLEEPAPTSEMGETSSVDPPGRSLGDFECSNLTNVDSAFGGSVNRLEHPEEESIRRFQQSHEILSSDPINAPTIALRIFIGIPKSAEKRSRHLVPFFLQWAVADDAENPLVKESITASDSFQHHDNHRLNGQDRKSMLHLFTLFRNPGVLYRSAKVFDGLCGLLTNGDIEIQKLSLKAIFTWKLEALRLYQENLLNILDDNRFRDEMTTFLQSSDQESIVQSGHRSQLMPILIRLLYGKLIARTGNQISKRTQSIKRKVVFRVLARFADGEIEDFLNIAIGSRIQSETLDATGHFSSAPNQDVISTRKQFGLLNMLRDMLTTLGSRLASFSSTLAKTVVYCLACACRMLSSEASEDPEAEDAEHSKTSLVKSIRQVGIQCLNLLFQNGQQSDIRPYMPTIFEDVLNPRLGTLPIDTAQSVSGILRLFSTWASAPDLAFNLTEGNSAILETISSCLQVPSAKDEVKIFVVDDILKKLMGLMERQRDCDYNERQLQISSRVIRPNLDIFMVDVGKLLRGSPSRELLASAIEFVTRLAPFVHGSTQTKNMLEVAAFLLTQPVQRVSPRLKGDLLQILCHLLPQQNFLENEALQDSIFSTISLLFGYFKDQTNRLILVEVLAAMAQKDEKLQRVAALCRSLNSYSIGKLDEPNFDERLKAFSAINENEYNSLTKEEWLPLLHNMLYYIRDTQELAIRSNASYTLRRFIEVNQLSKSDQQPVESTLIVSVVLPALRRGATESSELVRAEYLAVMAHLIRLNPEWEEVRDMSALLVGDDDEASFFTNILHIQQHRRLRALRRLAAEAQQNHLRPKNVAHYFLPLIEHFVLDRADDDNAHNLSSETVTTIGALGLCLEWPQFRAVFRRYTGYVDSKPDLEKTMIRLLGILADSLSSAVASEGEGHDNKKDDRKPSTHSETSILSETLPRQERLSVDLTSHLLPALTKYLHEKDESAVSLRVPVAVTAAKLLKLLPPAEIENCLPKVLTDVCNILRSRAQDSRDLTRKTLAQIAAVVGPAYFGFILKELRRALARGYQLHVLSYTVHSLLVTTTLDFQTGDLDYCLPQIVAVVMDDIFGTTGQEKDAEDYISKMKEVKSSKSYDSMEIVSRTASAENFRHLIRPLQSLLGERLDANILRKIDELLKRIRVGLLHNEATQNHQVLVFCHEIIRETISSMGAHGGNPQASRHHQPNKRFIANVNGFFGMKSARTSICRHELIRFAFDLLRTVLQKYDGLRTPLNVAGFMPLLDDPLVKANEDTRTSAIRVLTIIIKVPLPEIVAIYVGEAVKIIKSSPSIKTETPQAALKLVSAILRERRDVDIKENHLAYLLNRVQPDLEELNGQGVVFNLLKAVVARKIVFEEVYKALKTVASMMITNQTKSARDQARSVYFDFLMNFPQSEKRFVNELKFLVANLEYEHQEGRQSVMEVMHLLLLKLSDDLLQTALGMFFTPLFLAINNDDSTQCSDMAGALIKTCFERADAGKRQEYLTMMRAILLESDNLILVRIAIRVFGIYLDTPEARADKDLQMLFGRLTQILKTGLESPEDADWQLLYYALHTYAIACQKFPPQSLAANTADFWACVRQCLSFPHAWVKVSAARLQEIFFADFARTNAESEKLELPLKGSNGLLLNGKEMENTIRASLALLRAPLITEELASQAVRNLVSLTRMMSKTSIQWGTGDLDGRSILEDDGDTSEDERIAVDAESEGQSGFSFILQRTCAILRRGPLTPQEPALIPVKAAMQLIWTFCNTLPMKAIDLNVRTILLPLQNLTDPSIPPPYSSDEGFVNGYKALVSHGSEIMDMLQKKLGTTEYIQRLTEVREEIKGRREGRRVKRRIEAVAEPEKTGRLKQRKLGKKKEKRKEKSADQRSKRRGW